MLLKVSLSAHDVPSRVGAAAIAMIAASMAGSLKMRQSKDLSSTEEESDSSESDFTSESDSVICLNCGDRGERKGTGRSCLKCRGVGRIETCFGFGRSGILLFPICTECDGSGKVFSVRDRCRVCNAERRRHVKSKKLRKDVHEYRVQQSPSTKVNGDNFSKPNTMQRRSLGRLESPPPPYPGRR